MSLFRLSLQNAAFERGWPGQPDGLLPSDDK